MTYFSENIVTTFYGPLSLRFEAIEAKISDTTLENNCNRKLVIKLGTPELNEDKRYLTIYWIWNNFKFFFQGQFNYGSEDLWVNGGAGFPSTTPQQQQQQQPEGQNNNNAYFVQVNLYHVSMFNGSFINDVTHMPLPDCIHNCFALQEKQAKS